MNLILASKSERRSSLLKKLKIDFNIQDSRLDESTITIKNPSKYCQILASMKAEIILKNNKNSVVIAGDTMVIRAGKIFHKTSSMSEIKSYLQTLSGRKHFVYGGLCVLSTSGKAFRKFSKTEVYFNKILDNEITEQVLEDGVGKAGGYALQNFGSRFVKKIRGCYTNGIGISIPELYKILKNPEL